MRGCRRSLVRPARAATQVRAPERRQPHTRLCLIRADTLGTGDYCPAVIRWPVWLQGITDGVAWTVWLGIALSQPGDSWRFQLAFGAAVAVIASVFATFAVARRVKQAFGPGLSGAERGQVLAIVHGRATSNDPRLQWAATSIARTWTTRSSSPTAVTMTALILAGLMMAGAGLFHRPQFWILAALFLAALPWAVLRARRQQAAARVFLNTPGQA